MPEFVLKGPISSPPSSGWRIATLPLEASHLQTAWSSHPSAPNGSKSAWWDMLEFLKSNGIISGAITKAVLEISKNQWCDPDPARCRGMRRGVRTPYLPWAQPAWEDANRRLADGTSAPRLALTSIVASLTALINGPQGCGHCATHWTAVLQAHPIPEAPTLTEARHWLVDRHNDTREHKTPTPYEVVAAKFNWTTA